jgi:outer membrane receptor for ferrienterochelin and colicin
LRIALLPACALLAWLAADPVLAESFRDLSLEEALQRLEARGLSILYSSDLVQPSMRVREEPRATEPRAILEEILAPHGLKVSDGPNGSLMLVRAPRVVPPASPAADARPPAGASTWRNLEEVIVSASHYEFVREATPSVTAMTAADLEVLPDLGDDPVRAVARLPGVASSEFSAKSNMRGGEADETLFRFDGLRLQNPFHLKDFQSVFSSIDPSVISNMRIYAGGFPAPYGDRMSSVIDIDPLLPTETAHRELSLSFFNASALAAGRFNEGRTDWLASARRSNLDVLIDAVNKDIGSPTYFDLYGRVRHRFSEAVAISASALVFDDEITLSDTDHEEQARADYRDEYYWLRFDLQPSDAINGHVLVARTEIKSGRRGSAIQEGIASGDLDDTREFAIDSLQTDWACRLSDKVLLQLGGEWRGMDGRYDYRDQVEFDVLFLTPGAPTETSRVRQLSARPDGDQWNAYANLRFEIFHDLTADVGARWDKETLSPDRNDQISPRLSLLYALGDHIQIRSSWGRYFQTQAVTELQISDGVEGFLPPQRSDHLVTSVEYQHPQGFRARLEAYRKEYRDVRPRFENLLNTFVLLPELKPDRIRIAPERATAEGVELTLRGERESLSWWASYTWSSVEDESGGTETRRSWDQTHFASAGLVWQNPRWELTVAGAYHTGWPTTQATLVETDPIGLVATGPRNGERLEDYGTIDVRVARKFHYERAGSLTVFAEINNVIGRANQCCVEYEIEDEEGTGPILDLHTRDYLPITPSLGFTWRF